MEVRRTYRYCPACCMNQSKKKKKQTNGFGLTRMYIWRRKKLCASPESRLKFRERNRRRQISPSMRNGIPSAFSRNCLAGSSSQSISGQKSRGALCRAESGSKRMPTSRLHPDGAILYRENSSRSVVPSHPCYVFVDISKLLVAAPVWFREALRGPSPRRRRRWPRTKPLSH